jgi:ABC-type Zn2+ transport system substrate-binding protein/surface adhesin
LLISAGHFWLSFFRSLEAIKIELLQQLQDLEGAPSVQMQQVPPLFQVVDKNKKEEEEDEEYGGNRDEDDPDVRPGHMTKEGDGDKKMHESELYDKMD